MACGNSFVCFQIWLITNLPAALPLKRADNHGRLSRARLSSSLFSFFSPHIVLRNPGCCFSPPTLFYPCTSAGFCRKAPFFFFPHLYPSLHPRVLRVPGCVSPSSSSSGPSKARSWKAALGALAVTPRLAMAEGEPWQGRGHQHLQSPRFSSPMEKPGRSQSHHIPPLFITGETLTRGILHELARADWGGMGRDGMGQVSPGLWAAPQHTTGSFPDGVFLQLLHSAEEPPGANPGPGCVQAAE